MSKMNELAAKLKQLKDMKDELAEKTKENNAEIDVTEKALFDLMKAEGNNSFEYGGYKYSLQVRPCYSVPAELRDPLIDTLKLFGFDKEDIVTETIPAPKLNSIMKGVCEENDGKLPAEFDGIVSLYEKRTVSIRKGKKV